MTSTSTIKDAFKANRTLKSTTCKYQALRRPLCHFSCVHLIYRQCKQYWKAKQIFHQRLSFKIPDAKIISDVTIRFNLLKCKVQINESNHYNSTDTGCCASPLAGVIVLYHVSHLFPFHSLFTWMLLLKMVQQHCAMLFRGRATAGWCEIGWKAGQCHWPGSVMSQDPANLNASLS